MHKQDQSLQLAADVDRFLKSGGKITQSVGATPIPTKMLDKQGRVVIQNAYPGSPGSFIYFIQRGDKGPVKIGRTTIPIQRMHTLQSCSPEPLYFLGVFFGPDEMEEKLHKKFAKNRIRGEWFRPTPTLLATAELMYEMHRSGRVIPNFTVFAEWIERYRKA